MSRSKGVLEGVRIIELEAIGPVPFAGMLLADMGAEVLRIDRLAAHNDLGIQSERPKVDIFGRGKHALALDLKEPNAVHQLIAICQHADAIMEGFRPGTMERLGLGPEVLLAANPCLVFARMTGWGQDGPLANTAGHDINYLALSGLLSTIGEAGRKPVPPLNLVGDFGGGAMFLAFGLVAAILSAKKAGRGQVIDVAMVEGAALLGAGLWGQLNSGNWQEARGSNSLDGGAPWYCTYETADGRYVAVGAIETRFYLELLHGLGIQPSELPKRQDQAKWPEIRERFATCFKSKTRADWMEIFAGTDACVTPVLTPSEALHDPHMSYRGVVQRSHGLTQPMPAPRFGDRERCEPGAAPKRGEGGLELVKSWGLDLGDFT